MPPRNLILLLLAGLVLTLGAISAARRDAEPERSGTATTAPPPQTTPAAPVITGTLPADRVVRAVVGDEIELRVTSMAPDVAKVIELGVAVAVGPDVPGTVRLTALMPGTFDVLLDVAGTKAGRLVIEPAASG